MTLKTRFVVAQRLPEHCRRRTCFPMTFIRRIEIAEHSGTDAESIDYLAKEYDERAKSAIKMIAGIATILIRVSVILIFVFLIFRIAGTVFDVLTAIAPI